MVTTHPATASCSGDQTSRRSIAAWIFRHSVLQIGKPRGVGLGERAGVLLVDDQRRRLGLDLGEPLPLFLGRLAGPGIDAVVAVGDLVDVLQHDIRPLPLFAQLGRGLLELLRASRSTSAGSSR